LFTEKFFSILPYNFAVKLGGACGLLVYVLLGRYRNIARYHLGIAFNGSMSKQQIGQVARRVFANIGMGLAEMLSLPKIKKRLDEIIDVEGIHNIDIALAKGNGAVAASAHFGNWELISIYFAHKGYPSNILARPIYYEKYNEWISFLRSSMGVNVVYRTESPVKLLRILKNNGLLGIVADQDIASIEGVFIDFFSRKAYTPSGPVKLALAAGAPIIPIFIVRHGNRHKIYVETPIYIDNIQREDWVTYYTQKWSDVVESYIRQYPEQWMWIHKRWKTRPEDKVKSK
jgi:Kdo2-lipid IVA lauroyltransferase/acyltransferase